MTLIGRLPPPGSGRHPCRHAPSARVRTAPRPGLRDGRTPGDDLVEGGHEPGDVARRRELGRAQEQAVGQRRVVGLGVGQDQPGQEAALDQAAMDGPGVGDPDGELVEVRPGWSRSTPIAARAASSSAARAAPPAATSRSPCGPIVAR